MRDNVAVLGNSLGHLQPVETKWLRNNAIYMAWLVLLDAGGSYEAFEERIKRR